MNRSLLAVLALSCGPQTEAPGGGDTDRVGPGARSGEAALVLLDAPRLLRRLSLDLRGRLPDGDSLARVEADPSALDDLVDRYLDSPELEPRMTELLAEHWWTRVDVFDVVYQDYGLTPQQEFLFEESVGSEPLRLLANVIAENRPWTDVVTQETTRANDFLAQTWPLEFVDGPPEPGAWADARYTDGRPPAGVLSTNGLWWRYITTESNMNRGRAAAISRLLLCEDYLSRPITFTAADADVSDPETAIKTDPYCMACHASLDPMAASLFGFWWLSLYSRIEEDRYHPEREALAADMIGEEPAYYGQPMSGLADLGWHISQDPRFYTCAVDTFAKLLWRRPVTPDDRPRLDQVREAFVASGARPQTLLAELVATPQYAAGGVDEGARASVDERENTARMLTPSLLHGIGRGLVELEWRQNGFDQLRNDDRGYRVLAGGVDGLMLTEPQNSPGLPWSLVAQRTGQAIADRAVQYELEEPNPPFVFGDVTADLRPGDGRFEPALADLWWRMTATRLSDGDAEAFSTLWSSVYVEAGDDPYQAWRSVFSVILRDPLFLSY